MLHPEMAYVSQPLRRASCPGNPDQAGVGGVMDTMKDWILNKCRDTSPTFNPDPGVRSKVVTPFNIPAFTIPLRTGSAEGSPRHGPESPHSPEMLDKMSMSSGSQPCSGHTSPCRMSPCPLQRASSPCLGLPPSGAKSRSAPVSPNRSFQVERQQNDSFIYEGPGERPRASTNVDPMSIAAMSLPHLTVKTDFGFATLSERPNTRRKESLFHAESNLGMGDPLLAMNAHANAFSGLREWSFPSQPEAEMRLRRRSTGHRRRNNKLSVIAPLGVVHQQWSSSSELRVRACTSAGCSPPGTPEMERQSLRRTRSAGKPANRSSSRRSRAYHRRRSSTPAGEEECHCKTDVSSTEPSPAIMRRESGGLDPSFCEQFSLLTHGGGGANPDNNNIRPRTASSSHGSTSGGGHLPASGSVHSGMSSSCSCNSVTARGEAQLAMAELGELKFSVHFLETTRELRVLLIRAENLALHRSPSSVHPFAKLYLLPGKSLKKTSAIRRATRDPTFNQEFFFSNMSLDQLQESRLRIKMYSKGVLKRDEFLGQTEVELDSFDLLVESRMWKNLEPKCDIEEMGYLQVTLCFTPSSGRLQVSILQARDLPKHTITGAPDPFVKMVLSVPGRADQKKQTRVLRKTVDPEFHESFEFQISPKIGDLDYTTLTLTVLRHELIRCNDVMGQVRLGYGATEVLEFDHWNEVLQNPGGEYTNWHALMDLEGE